MEADSLGRAYYNLCEEKRRILSDALYIPVPEKIRQFEQEQCSADDLPYEMIGEIYTNKGEQVRSKSEKIIADELYRRGIPYH